MSADSPYLTSDHSESSNPMDELRHVQLLLKREEIFYEFQANEVKDLNSSLRKESTRVLRHQKLLLFLHLTAMEDKLLTMPPKFFDSLLKDQSDTQNTAPPTVSNIINKIISDFKQDYHVLADKCIDVPEDQLNLLTYSTLPGLFSYLWSSESAQEYLKFLGYMVQKSQERAICLARVVFALPSFRIFLNSVMSEISDQLLAVSSQSDAEDFSQNFVKRWSENSEFCPSVVSEALSLFENPSQVLVESFLKPAFTSPLVFGIVPTSLRLSTAPSQLVMDSLIGQSQTLWQSLVETKTPSTLPSSLELSKILNDLGSTTVFTNADAALLAKMANSTTDIQPDIEYKTFNYSLITVQDTIERIQAAAENSDEDGIEAELRRMLTGVDVIPLAAQSSDSPDMVELLKSQVQLARPDHRLILEMKIDDFENARKKESKTWTFSEFLNLLKKKFTERMPIRLEKLSKISLYNKEYSQMVQISKGLQNSIESYHKVLKFQLINYWLSETNFLDNLDESLCTDIKKFKDFFLSIIKLWKDWCSERDFTVLDVNEILHNIVMREIPIERYLKSHPELIEKDEQCYNDIVDRKEELLKANTFDFTATFQENPRLLSAAKNQLAKAFSAPLPLDKVRLLNDALHTLVFVLTFEGHKEIGADQWLPMTILLLVQSQPKALPSMITYIDNFVLMPFTDEQDVRLINEQVEYTFTMAKSALLHFQQNSDQHEHDQ